VFDISSLKTEKDIANSIANLTGIDIYTPE